MSMKRLAFLIISLSLSYTLLFTQSSQYFPAANEWTVKPCDSGVFNCDSLQAAIDFAIAHESKAPQDLEVAHYLSFGKEPFGDAVGPHKVRGESTGLVIHNGYIIAEWGDPSRVDMTFSVTKTFLSSVVGVAYDKGYISDIHDVVHPYMAPVTFYNPMPMTDKANQFGANEIFEPFSSPHNSTITWDHLLRQTSDWEGTLWGKPDWADRPSKDPSEWLTRDRHEPGTVYKYNDVRVNLLALAAMNIWRKPLPQVLQEHIMRPIGASSSWRWHGYENSWILMDGLPMQVVSGGGHWGGGMFINAYDQARLGYLTLNRGRWNGKQILSEDWVKMALTPGVRKTYGFMNWFLNTDKELIEDAPESSFTHLGAGTNMVYCDPENNLVIVARWIDRKAMSDFVSKALASMR